MNERKVILYIAVTLDGYIAGPNGELDWLHALENPSKTDFGYHAFYDSLDTVILGRKTYSEILGFDVAWPYTDCQTLVVSRSKTLEITTENTQLVGEEIFEQLPAWKKQPGKNLWLCGGGELITAFLNHGMVDEMILTHIPILLGEGIPLFPGKGKETRFDLVGNETYNNQVVNLHYRKR